MKAIRCFCIISVVILLFNNCNTSKEKNNLSTHKILFFTNCYSNWLEADKKLSREESMKLGEKLLDSIFNTYFSKCEYADLFQSYRSDTSNGIIDRASLKKNIEQLNSKQQTIKNRINNALMKCQNYLPYDDLNIFIFPSFDSNSSEKLGGISGLTIGSKHIAIFIDPFAKGWEDELEITIAHEFHRAYWTNLNFNSLRNIFLDRLIFEGKAVVFSHLVYPKIKEPWDSTLLEIQKKNLWNKIKNKLENTDFVYQDSIMFGIGEYPLCTGYILGRDIVTASLKQSPNMEPKYWTNFSPDFILKTSGYK
jgi:uncharacterized protein YjaZ